MKQINTGLDTLHTKIPDCLKNKNLGLLANPASVDKNFTHARQILHDLFPGRLKAFFSPQHGFFAEKQDNMIESSHGRDPQYGIPVYSLYSDTRIPTPEMFDGIDTLVIDIQDVGTRVYTFIYTISYCLEMAAKLNKSVVILDRPNPVGGTQVEGNILETEYASFVGRFPIPMRHGMTVGEISRYFNRAEHIDCNLTVIPMEGWQRKMYWSDTGRIWIAPSPNLPTPFSAMVYPGQVIFEGTNVSEGRGTTLPFEQFGTPFMDPRTIQKNIGDTIPGAFLRPVCFEPTSGKWAGTPCFGFHIHITDRQKYQPYLASLTLFQEILRTHPQDFQFKPPPYEYEYKKLPMDLILGSKNLRKSICRMVPPTELAQTWKPDLNRFIETAGQFFLYE